MSSLPAADTGAVLPPPDMTYDELKAAYDRLNDDYFREQAENLLLDERLEEVTEDRDSLFALLHDQLRELIVDNEGADIIHSFIRRFPKVLSRKLQHESLPFHEACYHTPELVRDIYNEYPAAGRCVMDYGINALHFLLMNDEKQKPASLDLVQWLIAAEPELVRQTNDWGWTPLHYACNEGCSLDVVECVIQAYPEALALSDTVNGDWPLHIAVGGGRCSLDVVKLLLRLSPENALRHVNDYGRMPLHNACRWNHSPVVIELICRKTPFATLMIEHDGLSPIRALLVSHNWKPVVAPADMSQNIRCLVQTAKRATHVLLDAARHPSRVLPPAVTQDLMAVAETEHRSAVHAMFAMRHVIESEAVQDVLRQPKYQSLLEGFDAMHVAGRAAALTEQVRSTGGMFVLASVKDHQECLYLHLREKPTYCDYHVRSQDQDEVVEPPRKRLRR